jgi:hypothetical protein
VTVSVKEGAAIFEKVDKEAEKGPEKEVEDAKVEAKEIDVLMTSISYSNMYLQKM